MCWLICEYNTPLPPSVVTNDSPSKMFGSSVTDFEYGPVVQPSVLRVDVQRPLLGDTAQKHIANNAVPMLSIVFVDQVHYNLYHDILFLCSAFGYHEREGV